MEKASPFFNTYMVKLRPVRFRTGKWVQPEEVEKHIKEHFKSKYKLEVESFERTA